MHSIQLKLIGLACFKRDRDFFFFFSIEDKWTATNSQCRAHRVVLNCAASHRREQVRSSGFHPGFLPADGATDLRRAYVPTSVAPTWFAAFYPSCWEEEGCCGARRRSHSTSFSSSEKRSNPLCELFLEHVPFFKAESSSCSSAAPRSLSLAGLA